jgi:branched-chain amino acid transport system substrate-binding protein
MAGPDPTRAEMLRVINEVGQFDISGDHLTVGQKMQGTPAGVFLTLIQPDGTFKPVDKL